MNTRKPFNGPGKQRGLTAVETAVVGMVVLVTLFAVFEVARAFYVMSALEEATRRGARMAAVCPVNDNAIREIAIFNNSGGGANSPAVFNLTTGNVQVEYVNDVGGVVGDLVNDFTDIASVRVSIQNYQHTLIIPLFMRTFTMPTFTTTMPAESLGVTREGMTNC